MTTFCPLAVGQLSTVYEEDWSSGDAAGWVGGEVVSQDRRNRPIHFSGKVKAAHGYASTTEDALSPKFTPSTDGSFRLTLVLFVNNVNAFGTNFGWVDVLNSDTGDYWRLSLRNLKDDVNHLTIRRNGNPAGDPGKFESDFDWTKGERDGVGDLMKVVFERDDATNILNVYATPKIDDEVGPQDLLISLGNGTDIAGLNQLRIHDALNDHNRRVYVRIKYESVVGSDEPI